MLPPMGALHRLFDLKLLMVIDRRSLYENYEGDARFY
jgi:hypothetical protein